MQSRTALSAILIAVLFCQLEAQINEYDISQFTSPDYAFQSLTFRPNFSYDHTQNRFTGFQKDEQFFLNFTLDYSRFSFSRKAILRNYFSFRNALYREKDQNRTLSSFSPRLYYSGQNQFFIRPKRFIELNGILNILHQNRQEISIAQVTSKQKSLNTRIQFSPKYGFGRIEPVTNAWRAKAILQRLEEEALLKKDVSHADIDHIATEITKIINQRVIDFRYERIYEYENIITYLFENGIADPDDYRFFAIFQDAWNYEAFRPRSNGKTFTIGTRSDIERFATIPNNESLQNTQWHAIEFEYVQERAKGDWQIDNSLSIAAGQRFSKFNNSDNFFKSKFLNIEAALELSYYLSSRIFFTSEIAASNWALDSADDLNSFRYTVGASYFVSPRLTYSINASGFINSEFNVNTFLSDNAKSHNVSFQFSYAIF